MDSYIFKISRPKFVEVLILLLIFIFFYQSIQLIQAFSLIQDGIALAKGEGSCRMERTGLTGSPKEGSSLHVRCLKRKR